MRPQRPSQIGHNRRTVTARLLCLVLFSLVVGAACSSGAAAQPAATLLVGSSELIPGPNRLYFGLLDGANRPVPDAEAQVRLYRLAGTTGTFVSQVSAYFVRPGHEHEGEHGHDHAGVTELNGAYAAPVEFDAAGDWGLEVLARRPAEREPQVLRTNLTVLERGVAPAPGEPAPRSRNPTLSEVPDVRQLSTADPPPDMYRVRIADAIAAGRPLVVTFATPALCVSRFCGPVLEEAETLQRRYAQQADFVHIEIYKDPSTRELADAVTEWRLRSEPWLFLVDSRGLIHARFEGPFAAWEVEPLLDAMLQG